MTLHVKVLGGKDLQTKDVFSKADPYIVMTLGGTTQQTRKFKDNPNPEWNEIFTFNVTNENNPLIIQLWDDNEGSQRDDLIAEESVLVRSFFGITQSTWIKFKKSGKPMGDVEMEIAYYPGTAPPPAYITAQNPHIQPVVPPPAGAGLALPPAILAAQQKQQQQQQAMQQQQFQQQQAQLQLQQQQIQLQQQQAQLQQGALAPQNALYPQGPVIQTTTYPLVQQNPVVVTQPPVIVQQNPVIIQQNPVVVTQPQRVIVQNRPNVVVQNARPTVVVTSGGRGGAVRGGGGVVVRGGPRGRR